MPGTGRDIHIDRPLSQMAIAYAPEGMIAEEIAPIIDVEKQADMYWVFAVADAFRVSDAKRAPGTEPNLLVKGVSSDNYFCENYALKDRIPYEDMVNADAGMWLTERTARAQGIKDNLMLGHELRVGNNCSSGSNVGSYSAVASAWTDFDNSDPVGDINAGINVVQDTTGYRPNKIVFGQYAWRNFRENANVIDRIYGTTAPGKTRSVTRDQAAALFEVEKIMVGAAYYNTAAEGQDHSLSQIWHDNVLAYYAPQTPRKDKPSFMYTFRWRKVMAMQAEVFQLPKAKAEEIHLGHYITQKITASALGFLVTGVGSSQ